MIESVFGIDNYNILEDEQFYYFFRALNFGDLKDINDNGGIFCIRTDSERYEGKRKYNNGDTISLEEVYDHIKVHHRRDTNCISLTSNANVALTYGRGFYKDKYVMVKVPKKEFGKNVVNAGLYMLQELLELINNKINTINNDGELRIFKLIDKCNSNDELNKLLGELNINYFNESFDRGIKYINYSNRILNSTFMNDAQILEKNKIFAKLFLLEHLNYIDNIIPNVSNIKLIETIGNAFSSLEQINYGNISKDNIIDVPSYVVDIIAILQQVPLEYNKEAQQIINYLITNPDLLFVDNEFDDFSIDDKFFSLEQIYEITDGKISYIEINNIINKLLLLGKSQLRLLKLINILENNFGANSNFTELFNYIKFKCFAIEPAIIQRRVNKGLQISESVKLDLNQKERLLINIIKNLNYEEIESLFDTNKSVLIKSLINNNNAELFNLTYNQDKEEYICNAIIDLYDWSRLNIVGFSIKQKANFVKLLKESNILSIYDRLKKNNISLNNLSRMILNYVIKKDFYTDFTVDDLEDYLNYKYVSETNIKLKNYQELSLNNVINIFARKKFASVILPTGAGKSFVALSLMLQYKNDNILYLAPNVEILSQIKDYIIQYIHGEKDTLTNDRDTIIKKVFPNLTLATYQSLLGKDNKFIEEYNGKLIILDELHRTGANEWYKQVYRLLKKQNDDVKVLGITATPVRDVSNVNMADEMASMLGYTSEEISKKKHIAFSLDLNTAIHEGILVNPRIVGCEYTLKENGVLENILERINQVDDISKKRSLILKLDNLRKNLDAAQGIPELITSNIKKGGKYIVFVPTCRGEDVLDGMSAVNQIKVYIEKMKEYLVDFGDLEFFSMLGTYSDKTNLYQLQSFENTNNDSTKFMIVVNKLNEGVHLNSVDGIIWFRAIGEESSILYSQQLGRIISPLDKTKESPIVIDIANNTVRLNMDKVYREQNDDFVRLSLVTNFVHEYCIDIEHINESSSLKEKMVVNTLNYIKDKYMKYAFDLKLLNDLSENNKNYITNIIKEGAKIDLWNLDLPAKFEIDVVQNHIDVNPFELTGVLKDFCDLNQELNMIRKPSILEQRILEINEWLINENEGKPIYKWRLPSCRKGVRLAKDLGTETPIQKEARIATYINSIVNCGAYNNIYELYLNNPSSLTCEEYQLIKEFHELYNKYNISRLEAIVYELQDWCERNNKGKKRYQYVYVRNKTRRAVDKAIENGDNEFVRGAAIAKFRNYLLQGDYYNVYNRYYNLDERDKLSEKELYIMQLFESLEEKYNVSSLEAAILELEEWLLAENEGKPIYKWRLPSARRGVLSAKSLDTETPLQKEARLASYIQRIINEGGFYGVYGRYSENPSKLSKKESELLKLFLGLYNKYNISNLESFVYELKDWCERNNKNKKRHQYVYVKKKNKCDVEKAEINGDTESLISSALAQTRSSLLNGNFKNVYNRYYNLDERSKLSEKEIAAMQLFESLEEQYNVSYFEAFILELEEWLITNNKNKSRSEYSFPSDSVYASDEEKSLAYKIGNFKSAGTYNDVYKRYKNGELLTSDEQTLMTKYIQLEELYSVSQLEKFVIDFENWLIKNNEGKKKYQYRVPHCYSYNDTIDNNIREEINLYNRMRTLLYAESDRFSSLCEKDKLLLEKFYLLYNKYNISKLEAFVYELEEWLEEVDADRPVYCYKYPPLNVNVKASIEGGKENILQRENRLARLMLNIKNSGSYNNVYQRYYEGLDVSDREKAAMDLYDNLMNKYTMKNNDVRLNKLEKFLLELEDWYNKHNVGMPRYKYRKPRKLREVSLPRSRTEETLEQQELRLYQTKLSFTHGATYDGIYLKYFDDDKRKELSEEELLLVEKYIALEQKNVVDPLEAFILELEAWCEKNNRLPLNKKNILCAKKGEEETDEQIEKRLFNIISNLKRGGYSNIYSRYYDNNLRSGLNSLELRVMRSLDNLQNLHSNSLTRKR